MKVDPPWVAWMRRKIGVAEFKGEPDNPAILEMWKLAGITGQPFTQDETPWCAGAVGASLEVNGFRGTRNAMARSFERWTDGIHIARPVYGAITVCDRVPPHPTQGHVALLVGWSQSEVALLGGNQNDAVNVRLFPRSRVRSIKGAPCFYWPATHNSIRPEWLTSPLVQAEAGGDVA